MNEPQYEVVWPLGKSHWDTRELVERVPDLGGKVIAECWDQVFRGEEVFPAIRDALSKRFPGIRFVTYDKLGNTHGAEGPETLKRLPALLEGHGADAVISGMGA